MKTKRIVTRRAYTERREVMKEDTYLAVALSHLERMEEEFKLVLSVDDIRISKKTDKTLNELKEEKIITLKEIWRNNKITIAFEDTRIPDNDRKSTIIFWFNENSSDSELKELGELTTTDIIDIIENFAEDNSDDEYEAIEEFPEIDADEYSGIINHN